MRQDSQGVTYAAFCSLEGKWRADSHVRFGDFFYLFIGQILERSFTIYAFLALFFWASRREAAGGHKIWHVSAISPLIECSEEDRNEIE
jgi:hypothetical protein